MSRLQDTLAATGCEVRFDLLTRDLYATDASIYQIEPLGVAFPRTASQARALIRAAADAGVSVHPRGAGSGLTGGAIGDGLVVDFARHNRQITDLDLERKTVRVQAGVVLDQLNQYLAPHGLVFGPDVATSSRATLGGMIANDSSGARAAIYGTTGEHVVSLEVVLADGRVATIGPGSDPLPEQRLLAERLVRRHETAIVERMPPGLRKRWPGYGLNRLLEQPGNLNHLLAGSEGTLAGILSATLRLATLPREKGLGLVFFGSVAEAMRATVEILELEPAAIEHVDRALFDQTRGQIPFRAARDLLELDTEPCESFLIVEFYQAVPEKLAALERKRLGLRTVRVVNSKAMNLVWSLRKAGLSLLTGCPGPAKPVTCVEDTAILPRHLPAYVADLDSILKPLGVRACYYGHAATGLLHLRPVLDLRRSQDRLRLRQISAEISTLARRYRGSFAAEHGVGMARTEFMREQLGEELLGALSAIKTSFDPRWTFNPGKILGPEFAPQGLQPPAYRLDTHLRAEAGNPLVLPFQPVLAFAAKDKSFIGNLEQCNGCGGCLKQSPTMCPTYAATGEEIMSTRGRANTIRHILQRGAAKPSSWLASPDLEAALGNCLSCKACAAECPSNVNLALLKAELTHARHRQEGVPLQALLVSNVDLLGRLGCLAPGLFNTALSWNWVRSLIEVCAGFSSKRPLPQYAARRFDRWFERRPAGPPSPRGRVLLWDDTFVRYHEPNIGRAAVAVLEAAGFEVRLVRGRKCCGRPAFSQGHLDKASALGRHNLKVLERPDHSWPVVFLEPSCWSMFVQDYAELGLPGADRVAARCYLFEQFIENLLAREPGALPFRTSPEPVAIHAHCHAKSLLDASFMTRLAGRLPGRVSSLLDTGCCGMAGAFGAQKSKYQLSVSIGSALAAKLREQPANTVVVASGTSCRQQLQHLASARPVHFSELLAAALAPPPGSTPKPITAPR